MGKKALEMVLADSLDHCSIRLGVGRTVAEDRMDTRGNFPVVLEVIGEKVLGCLRLGDGGEDAQRDDYFLYGVFSGAFPAFGSYDHAAQRDDMKLGSGTRRTRVGVGDGNVGSNEENHVVLGCGAEGT